MLDEPDRDGRELKRQTTTPYSVQVAPGEYRTPYGTFRAANPYAGLEDISPASDRNARLLREQQALNELVEQQNISQAARLERERRVKRKTELVQDASTLYRHYNEYLEYLPLGLGQTRNQYLSRLLANQRMPMDTEGDLGQAIAFAKQNWMLFYEYPKDLRRALVEMKAKKTREERRWKR